MIELHKYTTFSDKVQAMNKFEIIEYNSFSQL